MRTYILAIASLGLMATTQAALISDGLIGEYTFESGDGTNSSGPLGSGALVGTPTFTNTDPDRFNSTVLNVSVGNYLQVAANAAMPEAAEARTYTFFFKTNQQVMRGAPFRSGSTAIEGQDFSVEISNDTGNDMKLNGWGAPSDLSFQAAALDAWQHIAIAYSGTEMKVYVNGTLAGSKTATLNSANNGFRLGGPRFDRPTNPNQGDIASFSIDDVLIYNRELTDSEINQIATASPIPEPSSTALLGLAGIALTLRRRK